MKQKQKWDIWLYFGIGIMICAVVGAIALYMWGHRPDKWSGSWDDMIATIYIMYFCVPVFFAGCIFAIIGTIGKKKDKQSSAD